MTDRLSTIKARRAKATPEKWRVDVHSHKSHMDFYIRPGKENWRQVAEVCIARDAVFIAKAPADIDWLIAEVERLQAELAEATARAEQAEAELKRLIAKHTIPCPHCDFSSGQRGMDTCGKCDGTGRVSVASILVNDRDYQQKRAEQAEAERDWLAEQCADFHRIARKVGCGEKEDYLRSAQKAAK